MTPPNPHPTSAEPVVLGGALAGVTEEEHP